MVNRSNKGITTAEFLRDLEQREKKLRVKKTLWFDSPESEKLSGELSRVQATIKRLKKITTANKSAGIMTAAEIL